MFAWTISKNRLIDLIKKMSVPIGAGKYAFEIIAPKIIPNEFMAPSCDMEWIAKTDDITVLVRSQSLNTTGITEPLRIVFATNELISALRNFKNEEISITHEVGNSLFTISDKKHLKSVLLPTTKLDNAPEMLDTLDINYNAKLHAVCNAEIFHILINNVKRVTKLNKGMPEVYHIKFDGEHKTITTIIGEPHTKIWFKDTFFKGFVLEVDGVGEVYYSKGFKEVMGSLKGEIDISVIEDGSMLIKKCSNFVQANYLIEPKKQ